MLQAVVLRVNRGHHARVAVPHAHGDDACKRLRQDPLVSVPSRRTHRHSVTVFRPSLPAMGIADEKMPEDTVRRQASMHACSLHCKLKAPHAAGRATWLRFAF